MNRRPEPNSYANLVIFITTLRHVFNSFVIYYVCQPKSLLLDLTMIYTLLGTLFQKEFIILKRCTELILTVHGTGAAWWCSDGAVVSIVESRKEVCRFFPCPHGLAPSTPVSSHMWIRATGCSELPIGVNGCPAVHGPCPGCTPPCA